MDVMFDPFEEVKKELLLVPTMPQASLARQKFSKQSEAAINEQIKYISSSIPILGIYPQIDDYMVLESHSFVTAFTI